MDHHSLRTVVLLSFAWLSQSSPAQELVPGVWNTFDPNEPPPVNAMLAHANVLYAATSRGVFHSTDFGIAWLKPKPPIAGKPVLSFIVTEEKFFAGTEAHGVFTSIDGINWQQAKEPLTDKEVKVLVAKDGRIYAGTESDGIFYSTDQGENWLQAEAPMDDKEIDAITFVDHKIYTAGTDGDGVFRSADGGQTWEKVSPPSMDGVEIIQLLNAHGRIYAATNARGIFYSDSVDGKNWIQNKTFPDTVTVMTMIGLPGNRLLAGTQNHGLYFSADRGETWQQLGNARLRIASVTTLLAADDQTVYAGTAGDGVYFSNDSGNTWSQAPAPMNNKFADVLFAFGGTLYTGTRESGIFRSDNRGKTWFQSGGNFTLQPNYFGLVVTKNIIFANAQEGIFKSEDGGRNWTKLLNQESDVLILSGSSDTLFVGTEENGVFTSTDRGLTWQQADSTMIGKEVDVLLLAGKRVYAGTDGSGVLFNDDGGYHWEQSSLDSVEVSRMLAANGRIYAATNEHGIYFSDVSDGRVWTQAEAPMNTGEVAALVALSDNKLLAGNAASGIFSSHDGGVTWTPTALTQGEVSTLLAANDTLIFAGTRENGVFVSEDGGASWRQANPPMHDKKVECLHWAGGALYAGLDTESPSGDNVPVIFRSRDRGLNWTPLSSGLTSVVVVRTLKSLTLENVDETRLYAATDNGLYLQKLDFAPPLAQSIQINSGINRFTNKNAVSLTLSATGADSMQISEAADFEGASWQVYSPARAGYLLSANDGLKTVFARFRDISWNLSEVISAQTVLDKTPPRFLPHTPPPPALLGKDVIITQQVDEPNLAIAELFYRTPGEAFNANQRSVFDPATAQAVIDKVWITVPLLGLDYRIVASDLATNRDTLRNGKLDFFSITTAVQPSELGSSPSLPGGTAGAAYRMVSAPMQLDGSSSAKNVFKNLGKYGRRGDWRFYSYLGNGQWQEGENISMQTGAGYFMIRRNGESNRWCARQYSRLAFARRRLDARR